MNKKELIVSVAAKSGLTQKDAGKALEGLTLAIADALKAGEKLAIPGLGTFEVRERAARTGRNPRTGEEVTIAAKRYPAFKAGKALKDALK